MRDICIKTTMAENHHRKNLSIVEVINQDGFVARAEKKYSYYVSEQDDVFADLDALKAWTDSQNSTLQKKSRHVSIKKIFDKETGVGQMVYRVIGSFYVVQNLHLFAIVFMHSIKFDLLSGQFPTKKAA